MYEMTCLSAPGLAISSTSSSGGLDLNGSTISPILSLLAGVSKVWIHSTGGEDTVVMFDWNSFSVGL